MKTDITKVKHRLKHIHSRMGSILPHIFIDNVDEPHYGTRKPSLAVFTNIWNLNGFKSINSLHIRLLYAKQFSLIQQANLCYATGPLRRLTIGASHYNKRNASSDFDISVLLKGFPTAELVHIRELDSYISVKSAIPSSSLRHLSLENVWIAENSNLSALVGLQELHLSRIQHLSLSQNLLFPNLRKIVSSFMNGSVWEKISAPKIEEFVFSELTSQAVDFLCRHPSLLSIDFCRNLELSTDKGEAQRRIVTALPGLVLLKGLFELDWFLDWKQKGLEAPPFRHLIHLTTSLGKREPLKLPEFEAFVQARCLRQRNEPETARIRTWHIIYDNIEGNSGWRASSLTSNFHLAVFTDQPYLGRLMVQLDTIGD